MLAVTPVISRWIKPGAERLIAAAARVGAFPLDTAAFDAAVRTILPPRACMHVNSDLINVRSRDVVVEVYGVPEDVLF